MKPEDQKRLEEIRARVAEVKARKERMNVGDLTLGYTQDFELLLSLIASLQAENAKMNHEIKFFNQYSEAFQKILGLENAYSLAHVLNKFVVARNHLDRVHSCDCHDYNLEDDERYIYEEIHCAVEQAKEYIKAIQSYPINSGHRQALTHNTETEK